MTQEKIFTAEDVMALQEDMHKSIKVIGEQYEAIQTDLTSIKKEVAKIEGIEKDIVLIKTDIREILSNKADKKELTKVSDRVGVLEKRFAS